MAAQIQLLQGPAGAGKTDTLLARYRDVLSCGPIGCGLWIAPTYRYAADVRQRLLSAANRGYLRPNILTFDVFAESVLRAARMPIRPVTGLMKRQLLRSILERGHAEGRLQYYERIAETGGFIDQLEAWIADLKRLEIWPEQFEEAGRHAGQAKPFSELAWIYGEYQRRLTAHQLYDAEGRFWSARRLLREGQVAPFAAVRHVIVDGFTDFTVTQHEILSILAERVDEISIALSCDDSRVDLFRKSAETAEGLSGRLRNVQRRTLRRQAARDPLEHLEAQLFLPPQEQSKVSSRDRVSVIRAAGDVRELEEIARTIKKLLRSDPAIRPDDIVVIFRSLPAVADLVTEIFSDFGIPFAIEAGQPLARAPALKFVAAAIRLVRENWPYRRVLALLGSDFFRPTGRAVSPANLIATERLIHELQIPQGRAELLNRASEWAQRELPEIVDDEISPRRELLARTIADARLAVPLLQNLDECLTSLPKQATASQWSQALVDFAAKIGLSNRLADDEDERAELAWRRVLEALQRQERLELALEEEPRRLSLADLADWLDDTLSRETLPPALDEAGRVRVLSAISVRNLRVPYLFVAGLSETAFPQPRATGLCREPDVRRLQELGLPLTLPGERDDEEMLLFYEVVTRATQRLWLSYAALDGKAQPLLPSPYLAEVEQLFDPIHSIDAVDPRPTHALDEPPLRQSDWRAAAVWRGLKNEPKLLGNFLQAGDSVTARNLRAGLSMTQSRRGREFGPHEGIFSAPQAMRALQERYGDDAIWSVSRLERYAGCPFRFFLDDVARVRPLAEIAVELDPAERGRWLHAGMARLHRRLNALADGPTGLSRWTPDEVLAMFDRELEELQSAMGDETPVVMALREILRASLARLCRNYPDQHLEYDDAHRNLDRVPMPSHFEVSFGFASPREGTISSERPLELSRADRVVRLAGRIDRIDTGTHADHRYFNIVDYKTGRVPKIDLAAVDGTALQLEVYALAAQEILFKGQAVPVSGGYWSFREKGFRSTVQMVQVEIDGLRENRDWARRREQVIEKIFELVGGIQAGKFPVYSLDDQCTSYCQYRTVCRVNQARALEKPWPAVP